MKSKLLIIDDDKSFLKMLKKSLKLYNYSVDFTDNIDSVKNYLESGEYDVIITDKNINKKNDGIYLISFVKGYNLSTEIIIMTGHASIETSTEALKSGAFDFIAKPFSVKELKKNRQSN